MSDDIFAEVQEYFAQLKAGRGTYVPTRDSTGWSIETGVSCFRSDSLEGLCGELARFIVALSAYSRRLKYREQQRNDGEAAEKQFEIRRLRGDFPEF
jgi:hypothetical protein